MSKKGKCGKGDRRIMGCKGNKSYCRACPKNKKRLEDELGSLISEQVKITEDVIKGIFKRGKYA